MVLVLYEGACLCHFFPLLLSQRENKLSGFRIPVGYGFINLPCSGTSNYFLLDPINVLSPNETAKDESGHPDQQAVGTL